MPIQTIVYTLGDSEVFESLDRYHPTNELKDIVKSFCSDQWMIGTKGYWCECIPAGFDFALDGWKIHIAGTEQTAKELLHRLVPIFVEEHVAFKFCSDLRMVRLSTTKNWSRTSAGKFITIYPETLERFLVLAERCHTNTKDAAGPYILTDRPYKDSRCVFYRYGAHRGRFVPDAAGTRIPIISTPDGGIVEDRRMPYFYTPYWVKDPFHSPTPGADVTKHSTHTLKHGRYIINGAFKFSSIGGVYYGLDTKTQKEVVLREHRPFVGIQELLDKEARILGCLSGTNVAPQMVDLFEEGNHRFLVQERLQADTLWNCTMDILYGSSEPRSPQDVFELFHNVLDKVVESLEKVHEHGIVLRDISKTNVMLSIERNSVYFIDFELAHQLSAPDKHVHGGTFGYMSPQQFANDKPSFADDYHALGALIVDLIAVTAAGLGVNREGTLMAFRQTVCDLGLPLSIYELAERLLNSNPDLRPGLAAVREVLSNSMPQPTSIVLDPVVCSGLEPFAIRPAPNQDLLDAIDRTVTKIGEYILAKPAYKRDDRLWPCTPDVFLSNPISLRFGSAGILFFLWYAQMDVPYQAVRWTFEHASKTACPPGLYSGLSGAALTLLKVGCLEEAVQLLERSYDEERIFQASGLYEGAAGWGLANLHFWLHTRNPLYLEWATQVATGLEAKAEHEGETLFWRSGNEIPLGLGRGSSGIGLFYLYLSCIKNDPHLLEIAQKAVAFDIYQSRQFGSRILTPFTKTDELKAAATPGTFYGSSGVGSAALRIHAVTGNPFFKDFVELCCNTVRSRYTNKIWQDWGLAGCGEFLIDAYQFTNDESLLNAAYYLAEGILPYRIEKPEGIVFPGSEMLRISCDFGLGSAGIGMFLHRLRNPQLGRFLMLDDVIVRNYKGEMTWNS